MSAGRKRGARNKKAIIDATIRLLEEGNYSALAIEAVAERAGVAKTTIYRWWDHKSKLVFEAFLARAESLFEIKMEKTAKENFVKQLLILTDILQSGVGRAMLTVLGEEKEMTDQFLEAYLEPRRVQSKKILKSGIEKGEITGDFEHEIVLDMLYGPIYFNLMVLNKVPDREYIEQLVEQVMK